MFWMNVSDIHVYSSVKIKLQTTEDCFRGSIVGGSTFFCRICTEGVTSRALPSMTRDGSNRPRRRDRRDA